jgi:flagellar protein FliS
MNATSAASAVSQYSRIGTTSGVEAADPHRLIAMLLAGAVDRIAQARGYMERGEVAAKGESLSRAIGIIEGLRASLDTTRGGELALRLQALYDYLGRSLVQANVHDDLAKLEQATHLLGQIKEAWDDIPAAARNGVRA